MFYIYTAHKGHICGLFIVVCMGILAPAALTRLRPPAGHRLAPAALKQGMIYGIFIVVRSE